MGALKRERSWGKARPEVEAALAAQMAEQEANGRRTVRFANVEQAVGLMVSASQVYVRGIAYRVPQLGYTDGLLISVYHHDLDRLKRTEDALLKDPTTTGEAIRDHYADVQAMLNGLVQLYWRNVVPQAWWRRLAWKLGTKPREPFYGASLTYTEVAALLGFFSERRTTSTVQYQSIPAAVRPKTNR